MGSKDHWFQSTPYVDSSTLAAFPQTLQELDERIRKAKEELKELEFQRNLLIPICRFPAEILGSIFTFCAVPNGGIDKGPRLPNVVHVCRLWRSIAFNTPLMWSTPDFTWPKLAREMLKWSKSGPLNIEWRRDSYITPRPMQIEVLSEAIAEISRVQSFYLSCNAYQVQALVTGMVRPAPILESLTLQAANSNEVLHLPDNFLGGDAPRLRQLSLRASDIPWGSQIMKNLTSLDVRRLGGQSRPLTPLAEVVRTLHGIPCLEVLHLDFLSSRDSSFENGPPIVFNNLRCVELSSDIIACTALLRRMSFPDTCTISVESNTPASYSNNIYDSMFSYMTGILSTASSSANHPRAIKSLLFSYRLEDLDILSIKAWNTMEDFTKSNRDSSGKAHFSCRLTLGTGVEERPLPFVREALMSLGPLSPLEALKIALPVVSEDLMIQRFGNLLALRSMVVEDACAYQVVKSMSPNFSDISCSTTGQFRNPHTRESDREQPSPGQNRSTPFPAMKILGLFEVDFTADRDILLLPLLNMLRLRSQNNSPIEKVLLKDCTRLFRPEVAKIREVVDVEWDRLETDELEEDDFSGEDSDEYDYDDSDYDYDDY
ncbi:hypothetical protein L218DRAFT_1071574 [Marasmius fiardii PR-910]|nr:hypothetical protein L218DRAFT_1071574 [Marasmius fiardii PR-910]